MGELINTALILKKGIIRKFIGSTYHSYELPTVAQSSQKCYISYRKTNLIFSLNLLLGEEKKKIINTHNKKNLVYVNKIGRILGMKTNLFFIISYQQNYMALPNELLRINIALENMVKIFNRFLTILLYSIFGSMEPQNCEFNYTQVSLGQSK